MEDKAPPILTGDYKETTQALNEEAKKPVRVSYLTEQTSHHPPVSAFIVSCPDKGITARGFDQLSAKFTGTSVRVMAGAYNLGIFVTLHRHDNEEYQLTHPTAHLGGLLRGGSYSPSWMFCLLTTDCKVLSVSLFRIYVTSHARRPKWRSSFAMSKKGG